MTYAPMNGEHGDLPAKVRSSVELQFWTVFQHKSIFLSCERLRDIFAASASSATLSGWSQSHGKNGVTAN